MNNRAFIILLLCLLSFPRLWANEVRFTASAPSQVAVGERFRVIFSINKRPGSFNGPSFGELRLLSGPNQSSSSSSQIIGGQVTHYENYSFTYIVEATREGTFTVAAANATIDGRRYETEPLTIRVSGQSAAGGQSTSPSAGHPQSPSNQGVSDRDIFLRAVVNNPNPYQGQAVTLTYKLYTRVVVSNYSIEKLPSYQGFWSEDVVTADQPQVTEEVIDGQRYNVATIRQVVLFPQRAGMLTIEPLNMLTIVKLTAPRRTGSLLDEFFGGSPFGAFQNAEHNLRSNQVRLNVKPLPTQNRPPSFKGMVGNLDLKAGLKPLQTNVNEPITLNINISGSGNLRMLEKPEIQFPANLEAFDPNISDNIRVSAGGLTGSRSFEYLLIPRTGGTFEIPSIQFSFFDAAAGRFVTRTAGPFTVEVTGSAMTSGQNPTTGTTQEDVQYLTSDIRFIQNQVFSLSPVGTMFYKSKLYYFLMFGIVISFGLLLLLWRRHIILQSDQALLRNRKAQKMAQKRLKKAQLFMKSENQSEFYDEIFRALWGYLADKLNIPVSKLNKEAVSEIFNTREVPSDLAGRFIETLSECEFARFAPGSPHSKMDETYQRTLQTIITLEKELRTKRL